MTTAIFDTLVTETQVQPLPPGHTRVQRITAAVYSGRSTLGDTAPIPTVTPVLLKRRPAVVEAVQVTADNLHAVAIWCDGWVHETGTMVGLTDDSGNGVYAGIGQWVIRGQLGQFYPAPDDAVWAGYERLVALVAE